MGFVYFLSGFVLGALFSLLLIVIILRWTWRHKEILTELVREIYHVDLMPFVCRIEGLLNVALMELVIKKDSTLSIHTTKEWVDMALEQVKLLKEQIIKAVSKYEKYQRK